MAELPERCAQPWRSQTARSTSRYGRAQGKKSLRSERSGVGARISPLYKTQLYKFFPGSCCEDAAFCNYAHGEKDLRQLPNLDCASACPRLLKDGTCTWPDCRYAHESSELRVSPTLMKTKMCKFFHSGTCMAGKTCRFAHGTAELSEAVNSQQERIHARLQHCREFLGPGHGTHQLVQLGPVALQQPEQLQQQQWHQQRLVPSQPWQQLEMLKQAVKTDSYVIPPMPLWQQLEMLKQEVKTNSHVIPPLPLEVNACQDEKIARTNIAMGRAYTSLVFGGVGAMIVLQSKQLVAISKLETCKVQQCTKEGVLQPPSLEESQKLLDAVGYPPLPQWVSAEVVSCNVLGQWHQGPAQTMMSASAHGGQELTRKPLTVFKAKVDHDVPASRSVHNRILRENSSPCAVCHDERSGTSPTSCIACRSGLKVVLKNTFLTLGDDVDDDDDDDDDVDYDKKSDKPLWGARRRSRSL